LKPKFFTLPPQSISHPFIIINANKPNYSYLKKHKQAIQEVIIDSGIEIFRNPKVKDYPPFHLFKMRKIFYKVKRITQAQVWATIPDYCDDYNPKSLWLSEEITNIERTTMNIEKAINEYPDVNWLIPIQGWNRDPPSLQRSINQLEEGGIIDDYDYFALGNLCVEPNAKIIYETVKEAYSRLPREKKIHIFGLKLRALPLVSSYIHSFDSLAWTRPVDQSVMVKGKSRYIGWSCKTTEERERFFLRWLKRFKHYTAQTHLLLE